MLSFCHVSVFEARDNFWSGRILEGISGDFLYLKKPSEHEWGFDITCDNMDEPHSVRFRNGTVWSFSAISDSMRNIKWPLFLRDYRELASTGQGNISVNVHRIFSDSLHIDFRSKNVYICDVHVWHHSPAPLAPVNEFK